MSEEVLFTLNAASRAVSEAVEAGERPVSEQLARGSMLLKLYAPCGVDDQQPHTQDEVYVVASGSGMFICNGERFAFGAGDALFVPAGVEHRFEDFSDDFETWVVFYGPAGGEGSATP